MNRGDRTLTENLGLVVLVGAIQATFYFSLNHWPLFPSRELPLTLVDRATPFLVWTVWPYLVLLSSDLLLPLLIRRRSTVPRLIVAHATAMSLALLTFLLLPTHYPRPAAPAGDGLDASVYRVVAILDSPECCCPSGHIIVPVLGCWALWRDGNRWRVWLVVLLALLAPTILTTKQHYAWDLLGGLAAAWVGVLTARAVFGEDRRTFDWFGARKKRNARRPPPGDLYRGRVGAKW
jgi:hypothetical protein